MIPDLADRVLIVSMSVDLIRRGVPETEREAVRLLSIRFKPHDVLRHAGEALELAQRAQAGKRKNVVPISTPSERLAFFSQGFRRGRLQ